jgi:recombinational DNA repair ATPase RecF
VSDSREAMNAEILGLKQKSVDVINSKDYHLGLISDYDRILSELNPEFAEKQAQKEEIELLKGQMSEMSRNIEELMKANRQLIEQISNKEK